MRAISSNRYSGIEGQLDLMFAGSMFEHSCAPNCFAGNWSRTANQPRLYRALCNIEPGDTLSISYIQLPELCPLHAHAELHELQCRACGHTADETYAKRCL